MGLQDFRREGTESRPAGNSIYAAAICRISVTSVHKHSADWRRENLFVCFVYNTDTASSSVQHINSPYSNYMLERILFLLKKCWGRAGR